MVWYGMVTLEGMVEVCEGKFGYKKSWTPQYFRFGGFETGPSFANVFLPAAVSGEYCGLLGHHLLRYDYPRQG